MLLGLLRGHLEPAIMSFAPVYAFFIFLILFCGNMIRLVTDMCMHMLQLGP